MAENSVERDADEERSTARQRDPLGKLQQRYEVELGSVLVVCGGLLLVGLAVLIYGLVVTPASLIALGIGAVLLLAGGALLVTNLRNVGRRLEVRRRGIRYSESGRSVEMFWDEITVVDVRRTDDTYLGAVSVHETSSDTIRPSGPLTKTEFDVLICTADGRSIALRKRFLQIVPKRQDLIREIQVRAGMR